MLLKDFMKIKQKAIAFHANEKFKGCSSLPQLIKELDAMRWDGEECVESSIIDSCLDYLAFCISHNYFVFGPGTCPFCKVWYDRDSDYEDEGLICGECPWKKIHGRCGEAGSLFSRVSALWNECERGKYNIDDEKIERMLDEWKHSVD